MRNFGVSGSALPCERLRRRLDRRNLLQAILITVLLYLFLIGAAWLLDFWRIQETGAWLGPVLVRIGVPDTPDASKPDVKESPENPTSPQDPSLREAHASAENPPRAETGGGEAKPPSSTESEPPPTNQVQGSESGNSYVMEFDGVVGEVGRAGAYEFIVSYMPLPEFIDAVPLDGVGTYLNMSSDDIRREIEKYWEPFRGKYAKKPGSQGAVPLADRPYFWSLLVNALNYDMAEADWKSAGMRPVVIEFNVRPSKGPRGAELTDFKIISRTNNPEVDEAILYGLSRWVYYNDTDHLIRSRITYSFNH